MQSRGVEGEFTEQILEDLILQGYTGDELLEECEKMQKQVPIAVEIMLADAKRTASQESGYTTYEDIFEKEDF